ncbi:hypothetical protein LXL04_027848 [Taraxacum kok-saghyz]
MSRKMGSQQVEDAIGRKNSRKKTEESIFKKRVKTSAVCGPHLQSSAEEEVVQTSAVFVPCYSGSSECCLRFNHFSDILGILRGLESSTVINGLIPDFMPPLNESLDVLNTC